MYLNQRFYKVFMAFKWSADNGGLDVTVSGVFVVYSHSAEKVHRRSVRGREVHKSHRGSWTQEKRSAVDLRVEFSVRFKMLMRTHVRSLLGNWEVRITRLFPVNWLTFNDCVGQYRGPSLIIENPQGLWPTQ